MKCSLVLFLLVIFFSTSSTAQSTVQLELGVGEQFSYDGRQVRFKEVIGDSRCPRRVTCMRAGEAIILIEVFKNDKFIEEKKLVLPASGGETPSISLGESSLWIYDLDPYPETGIKIDPSNYCLRLVLRQEND